MHYNSINITLEPNRPRLLLPLEASRSLALVVSNLLHLFIECFRKIYFFISLKTLFFFERTHHQLRLRLTVNYYAAKTAALLAHTHIPTDAFLYTHYNRIHACTHTVWNFPLFFLTVLFLHIPTNA